MAEKTTPKARWQPGDRVRIRRREVTLNDVKTQLYFEHFADLTGTVQRLYDNEVWVEIDEESLPPSLRDRHQAAEAQMKEKWLNGLSEEGRRRLTEREKQFRLRYSVLVAPEDLVKEGARKKPADPAASEQRRTEQQLTADEMAYLASRKKPSA